MTRLVFTLLFAVLGGLTPQDAISTGGPLPDIRGFNDKVTDREAVSRVSVVVRRVAGQVYVIAGAGGTVTVFAGSDGILLVDTNFTVFYEPIMAAIRRISDKPIRFVMNTHSHIDHVQNNANFARQGAVIISTPNLRAAMASARMDGLPVETSSEILTLHFNGEDVLFIPLKPAHTNGDAAVYFRGSDVWSFGDVYRNDYPSVGESGTNENFIANYNRALEMTTPNTIFIPGHGQLAKRDDLVALRDAVNTIRGRFRDMVARGMTPQQILEARPSREFDARFASESQSATTGNTVDRWYRSLYTEISK